MKNYDAQEPVFEASTGIIVELNNLPSDNLLIGELMWVSEKPEMCASIAILCDDEQATNAEGKALLRGIKLTRSATVNFREYYEEELFKHDRIAVMIRTDDLAKGLSDGVGLLGKKGGYFIGKDFYFKLK